MNRARQQALFQATNQGVLEIRQSEINYYVNLHSAFGTQAVLIGGFTYGTFTQNNIENSNPDLDVFTFLYFVMCAITIASSIHVMLCTMFLQVMGPGLALNGPLGSMSRATEGMRIEQDQIILGFIFMICMFALSTVWQFWLVMTVPEASICTAVMVVGARQWYFYCERIYLRFYWNKNDLDWNGDDDDELGNTGNQDHHDVEPKPQPHTGTAGTGAGTEAGTEAGTGGTGGSGAGSVAGGTGNPLHSQTIKKQVSFPFPWRSPSNTSLTSEPSVELPSKGVAMEGYLTTQGSAAGPQPVMEARRWERRYCILWYTGEIFMYKSRQDFRLSPKTPVYIRPLRLQDFFVVVQNREREESVSERSGTERRGTAPRFQLTLVPRENEEPTLEFRKHWILQCDTEEELEIWGSTIRQIAPESCPE
mmetsp:Transcript_12862/g.28565  ORF Transcript_12862/g.28565 Transcript_12862/m.28565 type:complete len:421 (-) Transcript_12862:113-1375(-)